jgi:hypothetical protein
MPIEQPSGSAVQRWDLARAAVSIRCERAVKSPHGGGIVGRNPGQAARLSL